YSMSLSSCLLFDRSVRAPLLPSFPTRRSSDLREAPVCPADADPRRQGLLQRIRRHHVAERGEHRPPPVRGLRPGGRVPPGGPQVRSLARRVLVAPAPEGGPAP